MKCPSCGSEKIAHSSRHLRDLKQGNLFSSKPYRCLECWERFWISKGFGQLLSRKTVIAALLVLFVFIVAVPFLMHEEGAEKRPENIQDPANTVQTLSEKATPDHKPPKLDRDSKLVETQITEQEKRSVQKTTLKLNALSSETEETDLQIRVLKRLEVTTSSETITMNIFADAPIDDYQYRVLDSPSRLVLDVKGRWRSEEKSQLNLDRHWVSQIRLGLHPEFMRLVFDIKGETPALPTFKVTKKGLLVLLTR